MLLMAALGVVHALPVDQEQCLATRPATDREVRLDSVGSSLTDIERGIQA